MIVGFGAETGDLIANGRAKLAAKGCDLMVMNQVGDGRAFGTADNAAGFSPQTASRLRVPLGPKEAARRCDLGPVAGRLG